MFAVEELAESSRKCAGADVRLDSDHDLLDAAVRLAAARSFVEASEAHVLAELDTRGVTDRDHGMKTVSWAARETGCARGPIRGRLTTGRALRNQFGKVDDALCAGRITFDHAKVLADRTNPRIDDVLAAAQDEIIDLAESSTFEAWKRDVIALAAYADTDGAEPDPYAGNELHLAKTLDGRTDVSGSLDAALGAVITQAIDAKADELFKAFTRDHDTTADLAVPPRKTLRALALHELIRTALGAEPGSSHGPRAEVTVVVHDHDTCDPDGNPIPRAAADVWACDPDLWAVMVDHMGVPIDVGHTHRLATIAQRRAIAVRDGGCTFPGCDAPIDWCDHHHVWDWHKGGPTDLVNLVALCRHHHGVTHRTGWTMHLDDDQLPHWTTPSGDHLTGQRHHGRQSSDQNRPSTQPGRSCRPNAAAGPAGRPRPTSPSRRADASGPGQRPIRC